MAFPSMRLYSFTFPPWTSAETGQERWSTWATTAEACVVVVDTNCWSRRMDNGRVTEITVAFRVRGRHSSEASSSYLHHLQKWRPATILSDRKRRFKSGKLDSRQMLVPQFKFKRCDVGKFRWIAESDDWKGGRYRGFCAVGTKLSDVKRFAEIVRWCERAGKIEELGWHVVALEKETGIQSTWGGNFYHRTPLITTTTSK